MEETANTKEEKASLTTEKAPDKQKRSAKTGKASARMRILKRILLITLATLVVLCILLAGGGYWYVQRELPQLSGNLRVAGLQQPVSVQRDQWGVPYIQGKSLHDIFFAQGYTTAQDRLFQMELNRWFSQGRLAEIFDPSLLDSDIFIRTFNLYGAAKLELARLDARNKAELQAYADGVNAYIATHQSNLPLEFTLLQVPAEKWTPLDSLAYGRLVALSLDNNWYYKYTRALMIKVAGVDMTNALIPTYPDESPTLLSAENEAAPLPPATQASTPTTPVKTTSPLESQLLAHLAPDLPAGSMETRQLLGNISNSFGSNDWVVDGTKTASGKPLLANDPHLAASMPATWYQVALQGDGLNVVGFSFPGVPGVILGHNNRIAWGVTNAEADNTDLYLETLNNPDHPTKYKYNNQWLPLALRKETFHLHGTSKTETITFAATAHGPLLNQGVSDLHHYTPVSLKWTALQPEYDFQGFFTLDFAQNWEQFLQALSHISIAQNFVYADVDGNIGYRMSGLLPIRATENELLPVDGSVSTYEWKGYVPDNQMPTLFNPATHIIATANNRIVPTGYPAYITAQPDSGYRALRIDELLSSKPALTIQDFKDIQADTYSIPAADLTPLFIAQGENASGDAKAAAHLLESWNYRLDSASAAAAVYEVTTGILIRKVAQPVLGKDTYQLYRSAYQTPLQIQLMLDLFTKPNTGSSPLHPNNQVIVQALNEAMVTLRSKLGNDTKQWSWGKLHQLSFEHPLAQVPPLDKLFGLPALSRPGDDTTINIGSAPGFSADPPDYTQVSISSMREIIDLANFDSSLWIIPVGESGLFNSSHYSDQMRMWDQNVYLPMHFSEASIHKDAQDVLTLQPQ